MKVLAGTILTQKKNEHLKQNQVLKFILLQVVHQQGIITKSSRKKE